MKWFHNPIAFTPLPVTIITSIVYLGLIIALLVIHLVVPSAPSNPTPVKGVNLTEAWHDLQILTNGFHPYNSHRNDEVRDWLLRRIEAILGVNGATYAGLGIGDGSSTAGNGSRTDSAESTDVVIFNDTTSNITFSSQNLSVYFEGTNIIVYVRGNDDEEGDWWTTHSRPQGPGGILVNAHYDSVSTGYGATDDGVGVITVLQLIKFFTAPGNRPEKGVVALLNNGEEDFLNGANAFCVHPIAKSRFLKAFLNLEGAGAGGRATLFRSTDAEVTRFYAGSRYPFGTVISGDGFKRGFVRSQTDYIIFNGILGLRGLDVAFMEPRARYHTDQDDTRHTSIDSLWHMLSASLTTMKELTSDTGSTFEGRNQGNKKASNGSGSEAVWFDLFGRVFADFQLRTLFALSVTLLVVAPILVIAVGLVLYRLDKLYMFTFSRLHHHAEGDDTVPVQGWRGFFRFPVIFMMASAGTVGLAFLITKINPFIVTSSPYAIWSMMMSAWLFIVWFLSRVADFVRPTALHRAYSLLWMFMGGWALLVFVTVSEDRFHLAAGYFIVFYFAAIAMATTTALVEFFRLPKMLAYAEEYEAQLRDDAETASARTGSISSRRLLATGTDGTNGTDEQHQDNVQEETPPDDDPTESTSLLRGRKASTFAHYTSAAVTGGSTQAEEVLEEPKRGRVYRDEQPWSYSLPGWTWLLQFMILAPVAIIFVGQIALLFVSATYQTLSDGNSALTVYIFFAVFSILILAPLGPFMHRYTYHIPMFLFCVFAGTLVYNLLAFPFSDNNRLKLYFIQKVDLDTGMNRASLAGAKQSYLEEVIRSLPSATGQALDCSKNSSRADLVECSWTGLPPRTVPATPPRIPPQYGYAEWLSFNVSRKDNEAHFHLVGSDTRACKIQFNRPISDLRIGGAADDHLFKKVSEEGAREVRLWKRTWNEPWEVHVRWETGGSEGDGTGLDGRVICMWNDESKTGVIPALDEIRRYAPDWVAVTKMGDGLVEGSKAFLV